MLNAIKRFFSPTIKDTSSVFYLADRIIELQTRVDELEKENRELHDLILETEINLKNAIDKIQPVIYNIHNKQNDT
tara:strand:+ start:1137 stop:1364 length:228 start_codon:yes stop_codon:yes gene_type:complete